MFEILKQEVKTGDFIKLYLTSGKEPEGKIMEIGDNHLLLLSNGIKQRYFDKLIGGWEVLEETDDTNKQDFTLNDNKDRIENEQDEQKSENGNDNENDNSSNLKILGKIDLDKIEKNKKRNRFKKASSPKKVKAKEQKNIKDNINVSGKFKSFEKLGQAIANEEKEKLVPPNASIVKHFEDRGFGFLRDPFSIDIYFNYKDIVDAELKKKLKGNKTHLNIHICCSLTTNYKGEKAVGIHLPWTINKTIEKADSFLHNEHYLNAKNLANQILKVYPENIQAQKILDKIHEKRKSTFYRPKGYDPFYYKAKKAKDNKNYEEAINLFKKSLENEERLDSTVKDLASTYQELGEIDKGIDLLEKYLVKLPANSATFNFAANYYSAAGEYDKALEYLELLEEITYQSKLPDVYSRKAFCLIQQEKFEDALSHVEEILILRKDNPVANKMKEKLEEAIKTGVYDKLDSFVDDTDFSSFTGGLPEILNNALENCDYTGLTANVISNNAFKKSHLKQIRNLIAEAGKARPKERAKYLLTEARLIQILKPEDENELRSSLSRYCTALAISYEVEGYSPEISRYFYLISFELESKWQSNANQVSYYLMSFLPKPLLKGKTIGIEELLNKLEFNENLWNGIIDLLISNSQISSVIVDKLYNENKTKQKAIDFAYENFDFKLNKDSLDEFRIIWNKIREKRKQDYGKLQGVIKSIQKIKSIEELVQQLRNYKPFFDVCWLTNTDIRRKDDILNSIYSSISTYLNQVTFDDKEKFKGLIIGQISQLQEEIEEQPTRFSFNSLIPLLKHIEVLTNKSFKSVLEASEPKISLNILGDSRFLDEKNNVSIQISVKNEKGCSPIHNLSLNVQSHSDYDVKEDILSSSESIKGGEEKIITVPLSVNKNVIEQDATTINISGSYYSRNSEEPISIKEHNLSVRFYSKDTFEHVPNPYAAVADSGPVTDKSMFFGRELLIDEISNSLLSQEGSKCIIIQGQKRSGKSSLLFHLKENLEETNKFIPISFSLGLTEELSTASFYWQILNGISEYFEDFDVKEEQKPQYLATKLNDINLNPSIVFYDEIKTIKKELNNYKLFKNRKLLLLIDEFTYLYSAILKNSISPDFMKNWKSLIEKGLFSSVLVGQDVMPKFKQRFPNEFGVTEDRRLTYLTPKDAKALIEKPIWDNKNDRSRYIGKAIDKIIDYTSLNPYYIQIFCARLVDFMNDNKLLVVTEADVSDVAKTFTEGSQALSKDKFDNLLNAGDADLEAIPEEDTLKILRQIANNSRVIGSCSRDYIDFEGKEEYIDQIIDDLTKRDVIVAPNKGYYRIQVQMFNDWLLKH